MALAAERVIQVWLALSVKTVAAEAVVVSVTACMDGAAVPVVQVLASAVGETLTDTAGAGLEPPELPEPDPLDPEGARYWLSWGYATEKRAYPAVNGDIEQALPDGA